MIFREAHPNIEQQGSSVVAKNQDIIFQCVLFNTLSCPRESMKMFSLCHFDRREKSYKLLMILNIATSLRSSQ
jgi:hypothetical protein